MWPLPAPVPAPAVQGTALDKLSGKARAAAKKGDWLAASRHWQDALALPAEPHVGLSEAAAPMNWPVPPRKAAMRCAMR